MTTQKGLTPLSLPPSKPNTAYTISAQDGEIIYIPLSKSATRLLVTGAETDNAFAVVGSGGSEGDPIGFHYHKDAHDVFLCLQGAVNIWADDQCRTLRSGDFASVPPGTIHAYQLTSPHTEMIGLIVPGGWEEFFRFLGEPYAGPSWPLTDDRPFHTTLLPKLQAAAEKFDMIPVPHKEHFPPQPWTGAENVLPGKEEPYYLRSTTGPAYVAGGMVIRPLITTAEASRGRFAIGQLEGSSHHAHASLFSAERGRMLKFKETQHAFHVFSGTVALTLQDDGQGTTETVLHAGELAYVPAGTGFRLEVLSKMCQVYVFCSGPGLIELMREVGQGYEGSVVPEKAVGQVDVGRVKEAVEKFGCDFC